MNFNPNNMKPIGNDKERDAAHKKLSTLYKYANDSAKIEFADLFFTLTEYDGKEPEPLGWSKVQDYNKENK